MIVLGVAVLMAVGFIGGILLLRPHWPSLVAGRRDEGEVLPGWAGALLPGELVEYADRPGAELLLSRIWPDLLVSVLLLSVVFGVSSTDVQWVAVGGLFLIIVDLLIQMKLWSCTRYILTNLRAVRIDGWWNRDVEWLSWKKVTEVSLRKQWAQFRFQIVTIEIHTAHTTSSFRAMRDIEHPDEFAAEIAALALRSGGD